LRFPPAVLALLSARRTAKISGAKQKNGSSRIFGGIVFFVPPKKADVETLQKSKPPKGGSK